MAHLIHNTGTPRLWFGTEQSFDVVVEAGAQLAALEAQGTEALKAAVIARGGGRGSDPFELPPLAEVKDGIATMAISGSLISGYAGFMRLFGVTGYGDIQDELVRLSGDNGVRAIVLAIDSGGGHVNGAEETGAMIQAIDRTKPVVAFTDGDMQSAAYWLGVSAREVYGTKTAQVGSVGTLIVHTERSKARAEAGITDTIIRYGKFKALANGVEPLSEEGKAQLQSIVDESGRIFVEYAADRRGVTAAEFQKKMGEGRTLIGRHAHEAGLTDGVKSYQDVIAHVKTLDKSKPAHQNSRNFGRDSSMKATFAKKTLLAIAACSALDSLGLDAPEANAEGTKLEGDVLAAFKAEATELVTAVNATVTAKVDAAVATAKAEAETKVKELTAKVASAETDRDLAKSAAVDLKSKLDASAELGGKQAAIVKQSIAVMSVALGGKADVADSLAGDALVAEHDRLAAAFKQKFPAGGVAAVTMTTDKPVATSQPDPQFLALVNQRKAAA